MAFLTFRMQGTPPGLERLLCGFHRKNRDRRTSQEVFFSPSFRYIVGKNLCYFPFDLYEVF